MGDGLDTIYDYGNNDAILFGEGISNNDLTYQCVNGIDLKIFVKNNPNQGIIIEKFLQGDLSYKIEKLIFNDGTEIYLSEIPLTLKQDKYAETITGTEFNDTIIGGKGDDTLTALSAMMFMFIMSAMEWIQLMTPEVIISSALAKELALII